MTSARIRFVRPENVHVLDTGSDDSSVVHQTLIHRVVRFYKAGVHKLSKNMAAALKF